MDSKDNERKNTEEVFYEDIGNPFPFTKVIRSVPIGHTWDDHFGAAVKKDEDPRYMREHIVVKAKPGPDDYPAVSPDHSALTDDIENYINNKKGKITLPDSFYDLKIDDRVDSKETANNWYDTFSHAVVCHHKYRRTYVFHELIESGQIKSSYEYKNVETYINEIFESITGFLDLGNTRFNITKAIISLIDSGKLSFKEAKVVNYEVAKKVNASSTLERYHEFLPVVNDEN